MSGIILPGQENEPQGSSPEGSGIELPKGFARAREAQGETAQGEQQSAPPDATRTDPAVAAGEPLDLLFPPQGAQVQCPSCGTPYTVPVFSIIDFGQNPELRGALLGNQINVAICPSCGAGGALGAPLLAHDPEHEFLAVFLPQDGQMNEEQRQRMIGDLTQTLMRKLPNEARRGYMLQPKQFMDWQRFMEAFWEFEGVTPEMLRRQREQMELLQSLLTLANDESALAIAVERDKNLIDREFFTLLDRILVMSRGQADEQTMEAFTALRTYLLENSEAGEQVKAREDRLREMLGSVTRETSHSELIELLLRTWQNEEDRDLMGSLLVALASLLDYEFLLALAERLEQEEDEETQADLEQLRSLVLQLHETQREAQASTGQQAQSILQEVLQAADPVAELDQYAAYIDETFLALLAQNIQAAEEQGADAAVRRLRQIYDGAVKVIEAGMPPELQLLNELLSVADTGELRAMLEENRGLLTPELRDSLTPLEEQMRSGGQNELADRIKSIRAQIALMV
jgi:hypothetical protein